MNERASPLHQRPVIIAHTSISRGRTRTCDLCNHVHRSLHRDRAFIASTALSYPSNLNGVGAAGSCTGLSRAPFNGRGGTRTHDFRVMSPAGYLTAPPCYTRAVTGYCRRRPLVAGDYVRFHL